MKEGGGAVGDRITGVVLLLVAAVAWWLSHDYTSGFGQTIGPGAFPRLVSVPLGLLSLYLIARPGVNQRWPERSALLRQLSLLVLLMVYAGLIQPLGFLPTALLTVTLMIRLFGASWRQALPFGLLLTLGLYLLFEFALGMPLPDMPGMNW
ncbi:MULTISPECIES: tripartite tricarboxylate transporter TctB family protein [unclassified Halomonas]|uniref:tripartite tricarboxylate transporter TctB family protein n=1 Tax=unclassified Halomonas TaxID=2609666 RepID=UPI0028884831|nr:MULTISPECIES: tripartite tricarboxylate transporter TctB family protein [unclassified Halomonas]MDT0499936.1 tripartite tricarboxylate transporter TctB family protein [Halomonas sp. PAR7]MDT0512341.1 tripartite tricarboxylate transporter TctB family protein [Halomonas sp. LES1]MDT0590974.1 tripartite tricarboxylate transporter TctB family protein [Halomonas sp. PAR8]